MLIQVYTNKNHSEIQLITHIWLYLLSLHKKQYLDTLQKQKKKKMHLRMHNKERKGKKSDQVVWETPPYTQTIIKYGNTEIRHKNSLLHILDPHCRVTCKLLKGYNCIYITLKVSHFYPYIFSLKLQKRFLRENTYFWCNRCWQSATRLLAIVLKI